MPAGPVNSSSLSSCSTCSLDDSHQCSLAPQRIKSNSSYCQTVVQLSDVFRKVHVVSVMRINGCSDAVCPFTFLIRLEITHHFYLCIFSYVGFLKLHSKSTCVHLHDAQSSFTAPNLNIHPHTAGGRGKNMAFKSKLRWFLLIIILNYNEIIALNGLLDV